MYLSIKIIYCQSKSVFNIIYIYSVTVYVQSLHLMSAFDRRSSYARNRPNGHLEGKKNSIQITL